MAFQAPRLLSSKELNTIRGKALVGHDTTAETLALFGHIDLLEIMLDGADENDSFGTEGWRHAFRHPDAD